jgi:predicted RND superfamily exporter protein
MEQAMRRLARASTRRPRAAMLALLGAVALAAPGLFRLELRTDGHALVPPGDPAVLLDASIREHFDLRDPIVVFVRTAHADGIYNAGTLRAVAELTRVLEGLAGVEPGQVMSLATERRDRVHPGTLSLRTFLDPLPDTPELLAELRSDVEAVGIVSGTLVALDGTGATILVGVPARADAAQRAALYERVVEAAGKVEAASGDRVLVVGAPVAEVLLGRHAIADLTRLVPLSVLLIAAVLWIACRRAWGVALALTDVGACLVWTFGVMGWIGVPVYLTMAVLPVILTTIGLTDEIHLLWHYQRELRREGPADRALARTMDAMTRPVVLTSMTTVIGFLSFVASPIDPVLAFGVFAAVGVTFSMFWSLVFVPAALAVIPASRITRALPREGRFVGRFGPWVERRGVVLGAVLLVSAGAAAGLPRLVVQDSWIGGFAPSSPFRVATDEVNEALLGTHQLLVQLAFEGEQPLLDPQRLEAIGAFEEFLRGRAEVGGVLGTHSHLTAVNHMLMARQAGSRAIPPDADGVDLLLGYFDRGRGEHRRRQILDDDRRRTVVTIFLKHANYRDTDTLMRAIREYGGTRLEPLGGRIDFAGDVAVSQAMIPAIVRTQVRSLLLAFCVAVAFVGLWTRSPGGALLAITPACVSVLWVFGFMGWAGLPLGVATSMFCAITLGIGVDYAVHFLDARRRARAAGAAEPVRRALVECGPAIVADTLAVAAGFGLLTLSSVPANAGLGLLVALALTTACVLTVVALASLLSRPRHG